MIECYNQECPFHSIHNEKEESLCDFDQCFNKYQQFRIAFKSSKDEIIKQRQIILNYIQNIQNFI